MAATWYYLYYHNGGQRVIRGSPFKLTPALPDLLLRDGTIYFLAIVLLNVTDIALFTSGNGLADVAVLIFPITSVLISRLLLHLRKATSSGIVFSSETPSFVRTRDALPSSEHLPPITYAMHHLRKGATVDPDWDTDTVMYAQNSPWDNDIEMRPIGARRNGGRDVVDCDDSTAPSADTKSRTGSLSHPRGRSPVRVSFHIE
ncbi:uncharacterized protein FIBRA_01332 [Fibroporia radiculosa]|uniref:Uncharacterized protein n=1 Tax=Fibroporia radiculosa TaxID=599839 RepID=J4I8F4_9APHY|nr:uncharacterized protein FIBRA_01332 [Fibroporia radiculosa]CCL99316.1 predicted protein [Fibroporia radiculosa]